MKAILMSIKPQWVAKILNGEKTIEIRKKFPSDYVGWVYIYCCAEDKNGYLIRNRSTKKMEYTYNGFVASVCWLANRKVVARFWCNKVEEIELPYTKFGTNEWVNGEYQRTLQTETMDEETLLKQSCLSEEEIYKYLNFKHSPNCCGYAIHITKLEIFDSPKEISEFEQYKCSTCKEKIKVCSLCFSKPLTRAPESWCYIEI